MKSLLSLLKQYPELRIFSVRAALAFGSFLAMWSCLAFKMGSAPFYADSHIIGMLGLCGIAGALSASLVGKYVRKVGVRRFNFIGCGLILSAWLLLFIGENSILGNRCRYHHHRYRHAMYPIEQSNPYLRTLSECFEPH